MRRNNGQTTSLEVEQVVAERYSRGARERDAALCCPVEYDPKYLENLPDEILQKDYGCGDPSRFVRKGDVVLDLGSGGGKICYIAAQIVGAEGKVIGIDMNNEMLSLARKYQGELQRNFGTPVEFHRGRIQDLAIDLDLIDSYLNDRPVRTADDLGNFERYIATLRRERPMITDESVDVVVSNCVLNLVREEDRAGMFREVFRVLRRGGRLAISDIISDEDVPSNLKDDPDLWSGCVSGAFTETGLLKAFGDAGFYGMRIVKRDEKPWQTIQGIEFRSMTVLAYKGKEGKCLERKQAAIYAGPWKTVTDDDGHTLRRGERMAVCDKTYHIYMDQYGPYRQDLIGVEPYEEIPLAEAKAFDCKGNTARQPRESKGLEYDATKGPDHALCGPEGCC